MATRCDYKIVRVERHNAGTTVVARFFEGDYDARLVYRRSAVLAERRYGWSEVDLSDAQIRRKLNKLLVAEASGRVPIAEQVK